MQGENIDQAEALKYYNCLQFVHYPGRKGGREITDM